MPVMGEIASEARERIPDTWTALSQKRTFGDEGLQRAVNRTKARLFGEVVAPGDELSLYGPIGVSYAGIVVALDLIPAGYDHWNAAATDWTAQGRNEAKTFLDRAAGLLKLRDDILIPLEQELYPSIADILPGIVIPKRAGVLMARTPDSQEHLSPAPEQFEPPFERPVVAV